MLAKWRQQNFRMKTAAAGVLLACVVLCTKLQQKHSAVARSDRGWRAERTVNWRVSGARVSCAAIFDGNRSEVRRAEELQRKFEPIFATERQLLNATADCAAFVRERGYMTFAANADERAMPLAYSILVYRDAAQVERLLRAIYRPHNLYCLHVDAKVAPAFGRAVRSLAGCFANVWIARRSIDVEWGRFSLLEAELACVPELLAAGAGSWRYFINLTGQEFPLRTNWELARILAVVNGSVLMEATVNRSNPERFRSADAPPPEGITPLKGSVHVVVPRRFVEYLNSSPKAKAFLHWTRSVDVPDETYFATLGHSFRLAVPGAYTGEPETHPETYPFLPRFKIWYGNEEGVECRGKYHRAICIISLRDMPTVVRRFEFFVNKFHMLYDPIAFDCLEEHHFRKVQRELNTGKVALDLEFYRKMPMVLNHIH